MNKYPIHLVCKESTAQLFHLPSQLISKSTKMLWSELFKAMDLSYKTINGIQQSWFLLPIAGNTKTELVKPPVEEKKIG